MGVREGTQSCVMSRNDSESSIDTTNSKTVY